MKLDSEAQRKILLDLLESIQVQTTFVEAAKTACDIADILNPIEEATIEGEEDEEA